MIEGTSEQKAYCSITNTKLVKQINLEEWKVTSKPEPCSCNNLQESCERNITIDAMIQDIYVFI